MLLTPDGEVLRPCLLQGGADLGRCRTDDRRQVTVPCAALTGPSERLPDDKSPLITCGLLLISSRAFCLET